MMTVCQSIAEVYARDTGVTPRVMMNAPDYVDLQPTRVHSPVRLVHHGGAIPERRLETMIDVMKHLDSSFELNFVLVDRHPGYLAGLKAMSARYPNIKFLPPVPMQELPTFLNQFDVGIYLLDPTNFNNRAALPNKLFEFVQARLAIAIGPSPEMARLVREHDLGVVSPDFSPRSLAESIRAMDVARFKAQSNKAARALSSESSCKILLEAIRTLR
jgi:hypothetical protein